MKQAHQGTFLYELDDDAGAAIPQLKDVNQFNYVWVLGGTTAQLLQQAHLTNTRLVLAFFAMPNESLAFNGNKSVFV